MKNIRFVLLIAMSIVFVNTISAHDDVYDLPQPRKEKVKSQQSYSNTQESYSNTNNSGEKAVQFYDEENSNSNNQRNSQYDYDDNYTMTYAERIQRFHNPDVRFNLSWNNCINNWYDPYYSYSASSWGWYNSFTPSWWMPATQIVFVYPGYNSWWSNNWNNPFNSWNSWGNNCGNNYWGNSWNNWNSWNTWSSWNWYSPTCSNNWGWGNNFYNPHNHYGYSGFNNSWYDNNNIQNPRNTTYTPRHTTYNNTNSPKYINTNNAQNTNGYTQPNNTNNTNSNSYTKPNKQWDTPKNQNTGKPDVYQNSPRNNQDNNNNWNTAPTKSNNSNNNNGWNSMPSNNNSNNNSNNSGIKTGTRPK